MKISDIVAKLTGLESLVAADKFKAELGELQSAVKSTITTLEADLSTAKASIESLSNEKATLTASLELFNPVVNQLDAALLSLKIESKSDASLAEKFTALETFAKVAGEKSNGVPPAVIPAAGVKAEGKVISKGDFEKLSFSERSAFFKSGGKLTD